MVEGAQGQIAEKKRVDLLIVGDREAKLLRITALARAGWAKSGGLHTQILQLAPGR